MTKSALEDIATNELVRKRLAKLMALQCFRNSKLEDLHAGIYPSSQRADYSDVRVVAPFGEIAWHDVGRFSDDEMKVLMIDVVDRCYEFLLELFDQRSGAAIVERLKLRDPARNWNDPVWSKKLEQPEELVVHRASQTYRNAGVQTTGSEATSGGHGIHDLQIATRSLSSGLNLEQAITRPLYGNSVGAHPVSRGIA